jgi:glycosyltransferase involved in cell wall biosynthesis
VDDPTSLVVAMATFHREHVLTDLMPRLLAQGPRAIEATGLAFDYQLLIVDNDPAGGARDVVAANRDPRVRYVVEPRPGVANARNRALAEAADKDLLVFIDDDETPHDDWLANLLTTYLEYAPDAVAGPVYPLFEGPVDVWTQTAGLYDQARRTRLRTGQVIPRAGTGNLMLDLRTIRRLGLRFDDRFGLSGGEDSVFTGQLTQAGGRIVWCAEARADHQVPADRTNREHSLQRCRSLANSGVRANIALAEPGRARVHESLKWGVTCSGSLVKGSAQALVGRLRGSDSMRAAGEVRAAGGLGGLAGLIRVTAHPYGRPETDRA